VNEVYQNLKFHVSESSINVSDMSERVFYEFGIVVIAYGNDDMLP